MVPREAKKKILEELEKLDNVGIACQRAGVGRASFYRFMEEPAFAKAAKAARLHGRQNIEDIAESALLQLAKSGNFAAIKHLLTYNSKRYAAKPKKAEVVFNYGKNEEQETREKVPQDLTELIKLAYEREDRRKSASQGTNNSS